MNSNTINQFFEELKPIVTNYEERRKKRMKLGFNVFKIISDYYYRETFHGDILYAILSPDSGHCDGNLYVNLFIDMINQTGKITGKIEYYDKVSVEKEYGTNDGENAGRIDLLILGEVHGKQHCIIIENKLNNASDTYQQLPKYYNDLSKGYIIDAFVYLPLDPNKTPDNKDWKDDVKTKIDEKLVIIPAFAPDKVNLINNWLEECAKKKTSNQDVRVVIKHYISLLNNLTIDIMDNTDLINACLSKQNLSTTLAILENQDSIANIIIDDFIRDLKKEVEDQHLGVLTTFDRKSIEIQLNIQSDESRKWIYYIQDNSRSGRDRGVICNPSLPSIDLTKNKQIWGTDPIRCEPSKPFGWDYFYEQGWAYWDQPKTLTAMVKGEFAKFIIADLKKALNGLKDLLRNTPL